VELNLDPEIMEQLMQMFKVELEEQLQIITEGMLVLDKGGAGVTRDQVLDNVFRAAHNIKGAARGVDIQNVADIAHALESMLSTMRQGQISTNAQTINLCLLCADRMREAMKAFELQQNIDFDLPALVKQVNSWRDDVTNESRTQCSLPPQKQGGTADDVSSVHISGTDAAPTVTVFANEEIQLNQNVVFNAVPTSEGTEVARIAINKLEQVSSLVEDLQVSKIEIEDHLSTLFQLSEEASAFFRKWAQLAPELQAAFGPRVESQSSIKQATQTMSNLSAGCQSLYKQMCTSHNRLTLVSGTLQDQVRTLRLVPVANLLRPFARMVRDIAQELGKQVEYDIIGDDIEMDRPVLEGIKDPLMHLLRNAIDHGIEKPEERRAKGKTEVGHLVITVSSEGSRVTLIVRDDGAGINSDKIARTAVKKKLLTVAEIQNLSPYEKLELIFRPGFSSKEIITNISGRGVGLDVVASNVRDLKGNLSIQTIENEGTSFILNLPLTLSTDHGLIVSSGGAEFAIPTTSIVRVMDIKLSELIDVGGSQAILFEGRAVPVRVLADILRINSPKITDVKPLSVVVMTKGWQSVALLVDEIIGEREIVIKRFKPPLISIDNVIGGTLMGNGKLMMVLNPGDLVFSALSFEVSSRVGNKSQNDAETKPFHILVVDDSITSRTLQKNILESQGYRVTVAVNGKLGWEVMQQKEDFDLVVTDIEMPVMNGFELTKNIKNHQRFQNKPVIMVTSLASEADRRRGIVVGADAYITKSQFETKVLLDVINQLL
jgi:two-component system, chemotaxis family, sensor kinase CheA